MIGYSVCPTTYLIRFLLASLLFRQSIAAAIAQLANNLIQQSTEWNASDLGAVAVSSTGILNARQGGLTCAGRFSPLSPQSCLDAIKQIPDTDDPLRSANSPFLMLPQFISSTDGRCQIEIGPGRQPREFEIITGKRLRHLVIQVFRQCLVGQGRTGTIYEKGRVRNFYVMLVQSDPSGIRCADRRPDPAPSDCRAALESMPFDILPRRFRESQPQHPPDVQLPELFVGEPRVKSTCMIIVDTTGDDESFWRSIWVTAVIIDAMCVRRGLVGWSTLGEKFKNWLGRGTPTVAKSCIARDPDGGSFIP
ncbi:MAG: hypothetical protein Q9184_006863 [Pyrenodesmia sp. 2 TL-2023]